MNVVASTIAKSFAWSYSKLKNYETCPRRFSETELKKTYEEQKSTELKRGDDLHKAMESRVGSGTPLPPNFIYMEPWAKKLTSDLHPHQIILNELKLAVDRQGNAVGFFDKNVWLRGRIDYLRIIPTNPPLQPDIGHIVDYKTGKPKDDWTQLMLSAWLVFCSYTHINQLRTEFLWTEYNDTSHENFKRSDMAQAMTGLLPRVTKMEIAIKTNNFEPTPCGLCYEYCAVSSCEFHGKRQSRRG